MFCSMYVLLKIYLGHGVVHYSFKTTFWVKYSVLQTTNLVFAGVAHTIARVIDRCERLRGRATVSTNRRVPPWIKNTKPLFFVASRTVLYQCQYSTLQYSARALPLTTSHCPPRSPPIPFRRKDMTEQSTVRYPTLRCPSLP